jgi:hypothetical protein
MNVLVRVLSEEPDRLSRLISAGTEYLREEESRVAYSVLREAFHQHPDVQPLLTP